uniref:Kinesin family member 13A n=1 Tax=Astyanax mexicanus TaxID=7994 RepID=A0A8B9J4J3_ASTMX
MSDTKVKVAVRVRPMNRREIELSTKCVLEMEENQTILHPPPSNVFAFDHCFWSMDESNVPKYAGQEVVFKCLGEGILQNAFQGYNACIFAYGQTGSGKSYSMMGSVDQPGLIPRLCCSLFERVGREGNETHSFKVEVSYMEIYNEKVRDLLDPKGNRQSLKVREHKVLGPYVDGLSQLAVTSFEVINKITPILNTKLSILYLCSMNYSTSCVCAFARQCDVSCVCVFRSLTTLGCVISALADQSAGKGKNKFVPYRDSVLTWLLKDNLGGNSKTAMIATVSPAADNYEETLSTLRYADRAKRIVNHAVVNEDPNARIIRELREEVEKLKEQLSQAESLKAPELQEKLQESEKLIQEMTVTWEEKLRKTEEIAQLLSTYDLQEHTLVGADTSQDIQLFGIGIQPEHCVIDIAADGDVTLSPVENARTCVNGMIAYSLVHLWHGDRILWGNNHFFRVNLPKRKRRDRLKDLDRESPRESFVEVDVETASEASSEQDYSYEFAQMEVMMKTLGSNDPMQNVVQVLEKQYLEEKRTALEEQKLRYERELDLLRQQLSPERPSQHQRSNSLAFPTHSTHSKLRLWTEERDELFRQSLSRLREQVVRAKTLVREANFLSEEMGKLTDYQVTLQIPAANLSANRKRGAIVSEPAIQVRRKSKGTQVWTIEKLENKLVDMRDHYREWKEGTQDGVRNLDKQSDPFYEAQENHNLIGVANVFLECLFHDVKLQYAVPIISQQGEVAGRLHVELMRISGPVPERLVGGDDSSENSSESGSYEVMDTNGEIVHMAKKLTCRVRIREATGLPLNLSNFVFCQYTFWEQAEPAVAPPMVSPDKPSNRSTDTQFTVRFDHCKDFVVQVTEEFLEFISDGALAIEVWGHRCAGNGSSHWELDTLQAKSRTLRDRSALFIYNIYINIQGLDNETETPKRGKVGKEEKRGKVGKEEKRGKVEKEEKRGKVEKEEKRGKVGKEEKRTRRGGVGKIEKERKRRRGEDVGKTEEGRRSRKRNREEKTPSAGMEAHIPVLFLDLNADNLTVSEQLTGPHAAGINSILPKEHGSQFFYLPIIRHSDDEVSATCSWDSSIHDSIYLNRVTAPTERIYLIIKATVQLSHPASMELVLRKRIAVNIYNKQSFTQSLKRRMSLKNVLHSCGVTYEIVSNIPKASEEPEERETLALMAARGEVEETQDGETYIEKYTRGVLEVANILCLERLRQAVTVKEAISAKSKHIRRSLSTPNVQHVRYTTLPTHGEEGERSDVPDSPFHEAFSAAPGKDTPIKNKENHGNSTHPAGLSSPFKALSPQPPKFLKSLMPVREESKAKRSLEARPLLGQENCSYVWPPVIGQDSEEEEPEPHPEALDHPPLGSLPNFQPYVPEDFANFEVYNASLETQEPSSLCGGVASCPGNKGAEKEVSRSPTSSSCTSGYFSHSASNATLSDAPFAGSDSSDQLSSGSRDPAEPPPSNLCTGESGHCQPGTTHSSQNCSPNREWKHKQKHKFFLLVLN